MTATTLCTSRRVALPPLVAATALDAVSVANAERALDKLDRRRTFRPCSWSRTAARSDQRTGRFRCGAPRADCGGRA